MISLIKITVNRAVQIDWIWNLFRKTIVPFVQYAQAARTGNIPTEIPAQIKAAFAEKTVLNGVFSGMKYPGMSAIGSAMLPKLLGSYEKEIEPTLRVICDKQYSEIVDIGCGEGYYAVGLALKIPNAKVFAFDTNKKAIRLCKAMSQLNGVAERIVTGSFCDAKTLVSLPLTDRALIISDCEGYEKELFSKDTVPFLARHELLIEVHDFVDIGISSYLRKLFESSHIIEAYSSIDDIQKAQQYSYRELADLSLKEKREILKECRPAIMEWFYMKPRK